MTRLLLWVLIAGCASAARVGRNPAEIDSKPSNSINNDFSPFDVVHLEKLPRILQDAVPVDAPVPGSTATPGSYGSAAAAAAAAAAARAAAASPQPSAVPAPAAPQKKPAASPEPQIDDIPANWTTSGTSGDTTPRSEPTADSPIAESPAPAPASGTPSDRSVSSSTYQGTSTREAALGQTESIPTTSDQTKVVSDSSGSSSSNQVAEQLSGNQIAGIVVGVAVAAGAAFLGAIAYQRYKRHNADDYVSRYRRYEGIEMR